MASFDITQPPLTHELKKILSGYPLGGQIAKEIIQNSEDSGATKAKFFIDYTEYPKDGLLHEGLAKFQGPALLAYNNMTFAEDDFKSIISMKRSEKANKPLKIGKFGLGFNSVYHLTDLPSFVTNRSVVFLDPHEEYFYEYRGRTGLKFNMNADDKRYIESHPNQFKPFLNKVNGEIDFQNTFNGTLFRFPIRNKEAAETSGICKEYKTFHELIEVEVFESFFEDFHLILLFLRNIESIEVYRIKDDVEELIAETCIDFEKSDVDLKQKRSEYNSYLNKTVKSDKTMSDELFGLDDFTIALKLRSKQDNVKIIKTRGWKDPTRIFLNNYIGLGSTSDDLRAMAFETCTIPICNIAYAISNKPAFRLFCFLPLPETITSGLNLHVNGTFSLTDNRRDLKWSDHDTRNDVSYAWNEYFTREVLSKALEQLFEHIKSCVGTDIAIAEFYECFPNLNNLNEKFKQNLTSFLNALYKMPLIYTTSGKWLDIERVLFANEFVSQINDENGNDIKETVVGLFDNIACLDIPEHVYDFYSTYSNNSGILNYLNLQHVIDKLKQPQNESLTIDQKIKLLNFILTNSQACNMNGLQLLPLNDNTWIEYSDLRLNNIVLFENKNDFSIFTNPKLQNRVFNLSLLNETAKEKLIDDLRKHKSFYQIKLFDNESFKQFLADIQNELNDEILDKIWDYIYRNFNRSLAEFENYKIVEYSNGVHLSLRERGVKYYYYKTVWNAELIQFVENNGFCVGNSDGCVLFNFYNLPNGLANHPQMVQYIDEFKQTNLIKCFECIGDFKQLSKNKMSNECKESLLVEICNFKSISDSNKEFIKNNLEIFKILRQSERVYTTAIDCGLFITPASLNKNKAEFMRFIELSACINMIDCDEDKVLALAKSLGLTEYPIVKLVCDVLQAFIDNSNDERLYEFLKLVLMNHDIIEKIDLKCVAEFLKQIPLKPNEYDENEKIILDYLKLTSNSDLTNVLNVTAWFKCASNVCTVFHKPNEIYSADLEVLVKNIKPIVKNSIEANLYDVLGIKKSVELEDVVKMYCHLVEKKEIKIETLERIYNYFEQDEQATDKILNLIKSNLPNQDSFIFDGKDGYYSAEKLVLTSPLLLMPYLYALQNEQLHRLQFEFTERHRNLYLQTFRVKQTIDFEVLLNVLCQIRENKSNLNDLDLVLKIIDFISNNYSDPNQLENLIIPVQQPNKNVLEFENKTKCLYDSETEDDFGIEQDVNEKNRVANEKGYKLCCENIPLVTLKKLGIRSYNEVCLVSVKKFEQREDLLQRLRKLLDGYTKFTIFNELMQNGDDANATKIGFCLDLREFKQWKSKCAMKSFWCYNNSTFTEADFNNLERLGSENKMSKDDKIGKFGVGFNSVYNLTDMPSILSRDSLVILNPTKECFKNSTGMRINFIDSSFNNQLLNECLKAYENLFGFNDAIKQPFDGTILRLPLRVEESLLSSNVFTDENEIKNLIKNFYLIAHDVLLFTQNVTDIEVTLIKPTNERVELFKVKKESISYIREHHMSIEQNENAGDKKFVQQSNILRAASAFKNSNQQQSGSLCTSMLVKTVVNYNRGENYIGISEMDSFTVKNWLISSFFTLDGLDLSGFKNDPRLSCFLPLAGTAVELTEAPMGVYELKQNNHNNSLYCFLPTGIKTNLNFHINGCFRLTEDRKHLYERRSNEDLMDLKEKWNELILIPTVNALFVLIEDICRNFGFGGFKDFVRTLWPIRQTNGFFEKFENLFYQLLCSSDRYCVFTDERGRQFYPFSKCHFIDFKLCDGELECLLINYLRDAYASQCYVIDLPEDIREKLKQVSNQNGRFISDYVALEVVIRNRNHIERQLYNRFLAYFLINKATVQLGPVTNFGQLIGKSECIESSNGAFSLIANMFQPNEQLVCVFDDEEGRFPSQYYRSNKQLMDILKKLGLQLKVNIGLLIEKAKEIPVVNRVDNRKARKRSEVLVQFMSHEHSRDILEQIKEIEFLFCKKRPTRWCFTKYKGDELENVPLKARCLFDKTHEDLVGCVQPIFNDHLYQYRLDFLKDTPNNLIDSIIEQMQVVYDDVYNDSLSNHDINHNLTNKTAIIPSFYLEAYKHLDTHLKNTNDVSSIKTRLPKNWIFVSDSKQKLFNEQFIVNELQHAVEPIMVKLPTAYRHLTGFFERMGVKQRFTFNDLKAKLKCLKDQFGQRPLDDERLNMSFKIAHEIVSSETSFLQTVITDSEFYLPDCNRIMRPITQLYYSLGSIQTNAFYGEIDQGEMYVLNTIIPSKPFKIPDFDLRYLNAIGEPFGQVEKLTKRIANILERYSRDSDIFKEFIQNADDACADEICFILDTREHEKNNTFSKTFNDLQGPALCCWNNTIFQNEDYDGIKSLGEGSKYDDIEKIGRFGVGFNTAYHFTDAPQFISNNTDYVIFDPNCAYFPQIQATNPGCRIKDIAKRLTPYPDVLNAFNFMDLKGKTMFRFALRTKISELSNKCWTTQEVKRLFEHINHEIREMIIFLKHVKKIGFYEMSDANGLKNLYEVKVEINNAEDAVKSKEFYKVLKEQVRKIDKKIDIATRQCDYKICITDTSEPDMCKKYQIVAQMGFEVKPVIRVPQNSYLSKYYPFGSVAFDLDKLSHETNQAEKIFCFLPLHQNSPLPCNLNGLFALDHENRRGLFNSSSLSPLDGNVDREKADFSMTWNKSIIDYVTCPSYIKLIDLIRTEFVHKLNDNAFKAYLKFFDCPKFDTETNNKFYFENMFKLFYQKVYNQMSFIPILRPNTQNDIDWFKPNDANIRFSNSILTHRDYLKICKILLKSGMKLCMENQFINVFKTYTGQDLKKIDPHDIVICFKNTAIIKQNMDISASVFETARNLETIYEFCNSLDPSMSWQNYMQDCYLLLTEGNKLQRFEHENKIFKHENPRMFKGLENLFLSLKLIPYIKTELKFIKQIIMNDLTMLLPSVFDENLFKTPFDMKKSPKYYTYKEQVDFIWKIIYDAIFQKNHHNYSKDFFINSLVPIFDYTLLPVTIGHSTEILLAPIRDYNFILNGALNWNISRIMYEINVPTLSKSPFKYVLAIPEIITVSAENFIDVLKFLQRCIIKYPAIFKDENLRDIFDYISRTYHHAHKSNELTTILRALRVYRNLFNVYVKLDGHFTYYTGKLMINLPQNGVKDYCEEKQIVVLPQSATDEHVYKYLEIQTITPKKFYTDFLPWIEQRNKEFLVEHVRYIKTNWTMSEFSELRDLLKCLCFIHVRDTYKCPTELYDPRLDLFKHGFRPIKIFPSETFQTPDWLEFLQKLGLRNVTQTEEFVELTTMMRDKYVKHREKIDLNMVNLFAKHLIEHMTSNGAKRVEILNAIKTVKFIPRVNNQSQIIYKVCPVDDTDLVCMEGSTFEENENLVWTVKPIVPDYCNLKDKDMNLNSGVVYEVQLNDVIDNLKRFVVKLKENPELETSRDKYAIEKVFQSIYSFLANHIDSDELDELKNLDIVFHVRSNRIQLDKPKRFFKSLSELDEIDGAWYRLPDSYHRHVKLFERLGTKNVPLFKSCQKILIHLHEKSKDTPLEPNEIRNAFVVIKYLLNNLSENEATGPKDPLYFPKYNRAMQILSENSYYIDKPSHKRLLDLSDKLKDICIFDLNELNMFCGNKDKQPYWDDVFNNVGYFVKCPTHTPKPLSNIIIEEIIDDPNDPPYDADVELIEKFNKNEFLNSIMSLIKKFLPNKTENIESKVKSLLKSLKIFTKKSIKFQYKFKDGHVIPNSECEKDFLLIPIDLALFGAIFGIYRKNDDVDLFEYYQFISESIWFEIIKLFSLPNDKDKLKINLVDLIKVTVKLISNEVGKYESILEKYDVRPIDLDTDDRYYLIVSLAGTHVNRHDEVLMKQVKNSNELFKGQYVAYKQNDGSYYGVVADLHYQSSPYVSLFINKANDVKKLNLANIFVFSRN